MSGRLDKKVCIGTGGGRGIGAAILDAFTAQGASLVVAELDPRACQAAEHRLTQQGHDVLGVQTDVTSTASVQRMVETTLKRHGRIDVLVNNAGINVFHDPLHCNDDEWRRCMSVDLDGVWNGCKAVLPSMIEQGGGSIINLASTHSFTVIPGCFPYPVAKHAVIGLTRSLGVEYAKHGVRVNAIAPGYIETQLNIDYWNTFADPAAAKQATFDLHPPKRIGQPSEVAMTAVFLASDEAPFINASMIVIDGGRSVMYHD